MTFAHFRVRAAVLAATLPAALVLPMTPLPAAIGATTVRAASDTTTAKEARRVDRVPTPKPGWYRCYDYAQCATVKLPVDYDHLGQATTEIAVVRIPARKPLQRIGSLFLNPGGPGGSGVQLALSAPDAFSAAVRDRFDLVGFDPRGTNYSANLRCFRNTGAQDEALTGLNIPFPFTGAQEQAAIASAKKFGKACATDGKPLSAAMSTSQVARDMDVLRRTMGDKKLNFLGFSYGSYLGQVYANMFPDRVRAVAIDGVLDPVAWAGTKATAGQPQTDRIRSADGAWKALRELFSRCKAAGKENCPLLAKGDPAAQFDTAAKRLAAKPISMQDDGGTFTYTYADFVTEALVDLYYPETTIYVTQLASDVLDLTAPVARSAKARAGRAAAVRQFARTVTAKRQERRPGFEFPYDSSFEAYSAVLCSDGLNPKDPAAWVPAARQADTRAKYFGRAWIWTPQCASSAWKAVDEDAYRGPFTRRTASPMLIIGSYWDPATNYEGARTASRLAPNSRLLSSDNWGHTAFGTSTCATAAVEAYLLNLALPPVGTVCHGSVQPYSGEAAGTSLKSAGPGSHPLPIVPLVPPGARP